MPLAALGLPWQRPHRFEVLILIELLIEGDVFRCLINQRFTIRERRGPHWPVRENLPHPAVVLPA